MTRVAAVLLFLCAGPVLAAPALPKLTTPQSDYVEHCSGCHGMQGNSAPAEIPVLRGRAGYFLCLPEGREYLIRLPNIAYSAIEDDQELAEMMNFVVFGLGGDSAPRGARPFTGAEVGRLRERALATQSLIAARQAVVEKMVAGCAAPSSMRDYSDAPALR